VINKVVMWLGDYVLRGRIYSMFWRDEPLCVFLMSDPPVQRDLQAREAYRLRTGAGAHAALEDESVTRHSTPIECRVQGGQSQNDHGRYILR
jgi:hypothetical protein